MKTKFLIFIINIFVILSIFAYDKNQLNGGSLTEENLQKKLDGDEYFNNLPKIQIGMEKQNLYNQVLPVEFRKFFLEFWCIYFVKAAKLELK